MVSLMTREKFEELSERIDPKVKAAIDDYTERLMRGENPDIRELDWCLPHRVRIDLEEGA